MRAAAALLLLAVPAHAHLIVFCTSSDPATPGVVTFYLGTYHTTNCAGGGSVPGTMHIQTGSGALQTGAFNDAKCAAGNPSKGSTGNVFTESLRQSWSLPSNSVRQCYTRPGSSNGNSYTGVIRTNTDGSTVYDAAVLGGTEASVGNECYSTSDPINSWYRVAVTGASSGTFEVWTTGTNVDLNPGSGTGNPCTMSPTVHYQMALTVATGGQACQPFTGSVTGATVGADCSAGTVQAGVVCTIPCSQVQAGELRCDDGNWVNTYACVAATCSSTASSTFTGQVGVGAPCTFSSAPGTSCPPTCAGTDFAPAGSAVVCQNDGTWAGSGQCLPAGAAPPTGGMVVSGDPFTRYGGKNTQFYLPLGVEHTLLTCPNVELRGRTKHSGVAGDTQQWFDHFTVLTGQAGHQSTVTVGLLDKQAGSASGSTAVDRVVAALQKSAQLEVLRLAVDGVAAGGAVVPQPAGGWKVEAKHIGHAEVVALTAGDVKVQLQSAIATKFAAVENNLQYMHIDVEFDGLDAKSCTGVFPEIWGVVPMSNSTERLLTP